jgi:hypothetical protein
MARVLTRHLSNFLPSDEGWALYYHLQEVITWEAGIPSRKGPTRLAKSIDLDQYPEITAVLARALKHLYPEKETAGVYGVYLNYYRDGSMWTPNHSHKGSTQLIISLGATRVLKVGKKDYSLQNGDVIVFGSSVHGVPAQPEVQEGRISIAVFLEK